MLSRQLQSLSYSLHTPKLGDTKTRIKDLARKTRHAVDSPQPVPRVKMEGDPNYKLDMGKIVLGVIHIKNIPKKLQNNIL